MKPTEETPGALPPSSNVPAPIASQPAAGAVSTATEATAEAIVTPPENTVDTSLPEGSIQWNASEFIDHQKNAGWFLLLSLAGVAACALVYLFARDILATVVVGIAVLTFGIIARKKPRTLTYTLSPTWLQIGPKQYSYDDFRTFSVVQDGGLFSILLAPNQRFIPPLTIYFDPDDGEEIFDLLADRIPHEERKVDPIDRLMRRIRF